MDKENRVKEILNELKKLGLICVAPTIMLTFEFHAKFAESSEPIFEFLKNEMIVNVFFVVSFSVIFWCSYKVSKLIEKGQKLNDESETS